MGQMLSAAVVTRAAPMSSESTQKPETAAFRAKPTTTNRPAVNLTCRSMAQRDLPRTRSPPASFHAMTPPSSTLAARHPAAARRSPAWPARWPDSQISTIGPIASANCSQRPASRSSGRCTDPAMCLVSYSALVRTSTSVTAGPASNWLINSWALTVVMSMASPFRRRSLQVQCAPTNGRLAPHGGVDLSPGARAVRRRWGPRRCRVRGRSCSTLR